MDTLRLGTVDLNDGMTTFIRTGHDMGAPQTLTQQIERLLTDGSVVTGARSGNRQIQLPVQIRAGTRAAAVAIEAAIALQVEQAYSPLLWTPQSGQATVFDCFRGSVVREYSILESRQGLIQLTVTLPALPFARSQLPVTLFPTATVPTVLDTFDAASGSRTTTDSGYAGAGTFSYDTTVKTEGAASLKLTDVTPIVGGGPLLVTSDISFAAEDLTGLPVVLMAWMLGLPSNGDSAVYSTTNGGFALTSTWSLTLRSSAGTSTWTVTQNPMQAPYAWQTVAWQIAQSPTSTTGTFNIAAVTSSAVTWAFSGPGYTFSVYRDYLRAAPANGLNITTAVGTARLDAVKGTARTPVELSVVTNAGTATRLLICRYTNPPGNFDPILSGTVAGTTATTAADASAITGTRYSLGAGGLVRYQRAANTLAGTYTVMARLRGDYAGPAVATVAVNSYISSDATGAPQAISRDFDAFTLPPIGGGGAWQILSLGQLTLPPRGVRANSSSLVNFDLTSNQPIYVDQLYLVDAAGDSVLIDTGRAFSRYLLAAPDPSAQRGDVLAGTLADQSDFLSVSPWLTGQPILNLDPGSNLVLVVADQADAGVGVQVTYYPRFQSEALP